MLPTIAAAAFIIYRLGRQAWGSCWLVTPLIMAMIVAIAGPRSTATPNTVLDGLFCGCQHGQSCSCRFAFWLVFYHNQQQPHVLYQDHCQHHILLLSIVCTSMFIPSPLSITRVVAWWRIADGVCHGAPYCLLTCDRIDHGPFRDWDCRSAFRCCVVCVFRCCVVVCMSWLPLLFPLSDRVPVVVVVVAAAAVVFQLYLEGRTTWWQRSW